MFLILPTPNPRMGELGMSWGHLLYTLLAPGNKCLSKRGPWAWMAWPWATKRGGGVGGWGVAFALHAYPYIQMGDFLSTWAKHLGTISFALSSWPSALR